MDEKIFGLIALAEEHTAAVRASLDGLAAERAAYREDRAEAAMAVQRAEAAIDALSRAVTEALPGVQAAAVGGASEGVAQQMKAAGATAAQALERATAPVVVALNSSAEALGVAEAAMRKAAGGFRWKWIATTGGCVIALVVALNIAGAGMVLWSRYKIDILSAQRAQIESEVAEMEKTAARWAAKFGKAQVNFCGPMKKPCVRVDTAAGNFADSTGPDLFILKGY